MALLQAARLEEAKTVFLEIHRMVPNDAGILHHLGLVCAQQSDFAAAERWLKQAVLASPGNVRIRIHTGNVLLQQQKSQEAKVHYEAALAEQPRAAEAHFYLATVLVGEGSLADAATHFRRSAQLQPGHADSHANLGMVYEVLHKLADARNAVNTALSLNPDHTAALLLLAKLEKREGHYAQAEELLARVLSPGAHPSLVATAAMERGHVLDRLGRYTEAYESFSMGKSAWSWIADQAPFGKELYRNRIEQNKRWITRKFTQQWHSSAAPHRAGHDPVFFVGFPRSGTTLVEQILNQHPGIVTTDEKPLVQNVIDGIPLLLGSNESYPQNLSRLTSRDLAVLQHGYWQQVEREIGTLSPDMRLVDKLPLNLIDLGFICRLFPEARILVAIRDPRDVCLSCFMQGFQLNPAMINFLSIEATTDFYRQVMGLWLHYRAILPMHWYQYRYEDLVDDFENTTKGILDSLGVAWSGTLNEFHINAQQRYINTPSYQDVATPIYRRAMARWKNYEKYIDPYMDRLTPFLEEFGY